MNLESAPAMIETRLNFVVLCETQAVPSRFILKRNMRAVNPEEQMIVDKIFHDVSTELEHQVVFFPEWTNEDIEGCFKGPLFRLNVNFTGSLRDTIQNYLRLRLWTKLHEASVQMSDFQIQVTNDAVWLDPHIVTVASEGKVYSGKFEFTYGPNHRDDCSTCQNGKRLLNLALNQLGGLIILNRNQVSDDGFMFGDYSIRPSKNMQVRIGDLQNGATIEERFKNWFVEENAGAIEMAAIINVSFVGV